MTERKITPEEINQLFDFCRKHGIRHHDLQMELVDHLATSIEDYWMQKPNMPFQYALNHVFDGFGFLSFDKIKRAKEKALQKKHNRLIFQFVAAYFKLPKLLLTIALTLLIFTILQFTENDGIVIGISIFLFLPFGIFYHFYFFPKYQDVKIISGKSFLMIDYLRNLQWQLLFIFLLPFQSISYYSVFKEGISNIWIQLLVSFTIVLLSIMIYASCFYAPLKFREHFTNQFHQFVKS